MATRNKSGKNNHRRRRGKFWTRRSDERLLDLRMCDLNLAIEGTPLQARIDKVREELWQRDIQFQPYFWLSDEWFTPDGMTGTAIPFYLAHPRLMRLERAMMGEVEGGTHEWCMKLIRHEVGHALDHAYRLNLRRKRQQLFGHASRRYPRMYRPNPHSKKHVQHLSYWYAQSHPSEDFAETFALWLTPRSNWRRRYRGWPALKKLQYIDELMGEIAGCKPPVRTRAQLDRLRTLKKTLRQHYERKEGGYEIEWPDFYDHDLYHLFTDPGGPSRREFASAFIRRRRPEILRLVSPWIGEYRYQLDHVMAEMIGRCRELKLRVVGPDPRVTRDFAMILCKHTVDSLYRKRQRVEM